VIGVARKPLIYKLRKVENMSKSVLINNVWSNGEGAPVSILNPATSDEIANFNAATEAQVKNAVKAARDAFASWSQKSRAERIVIIENYGKELEKRRDELALCLAKDTGKPLWETKGEASAMIGKIAISVRGYNERTGELQKDTAFGHLAMTHKAYGVMAVLGPFNFPGHLPNGHIVPALLAGNTIVFKPSELAPMVSFIMAEAFLAAGLPDGVLNIVNGARDTGAALLGADGIDGVLFTGSATTGTYIHKLFGGRPEVILALEMGGNNPLIVWDAQDIDAAADMIIHSSFITSGQRCSCARRIILPDTAFADEVLEKVKAKCAKMRIGKYDDAAEPFIGPVISAQMAQNVIKFQDGLKALGGKPIIEAEILAIGDAFVKPGLIDMTNAKSADDEELFAPFAQVFRVKTLDDAITLANKTRFGLSAGLVSEDAGNWDKVVNLVRAGLINWNRPTTGASSELPFGGPGLSGNGRPSAFYAADYCAYPLAQQNANKVCPIPATGFN
jgi:succinylglutamic semialdehyde dehydrogenase